VELEFDELPSEEIRPGDLVFVMPREDDALEDLAAVMNGTYWCHVGIACGDGLVASARCDSGFVVLGDGGGVRLDPLTWYREEMGRHVFVGRVGRVGGPWGETEDPRFAELRAEAASFGRLLARDGTRERTRFSMTKTVLAGIARRAGDYWTMISSEAIVALLDALDVAGEALAATPQWPVFASGDFVSTAYRIPFTRGDLQGPMVFGRHLGPEPDYEALGVEVIREQADRHGTVELAQVLEVMERHDPVVLRPTVETFGRWWRQGAPGPELVPSPPSSPKHEEVPGAAQKIAAPLVSAAVLSRAWWLEKICYAVP
jgi:hypothetical protein